MAQNGSSVNHYKALEGLLRPLRGLIRPIKDLPGPVPINETNEKLPYVRSVSIHHGCQLVSLFLCEAPLSHALVMVILGSYSQGTYTYTDTLL